MCFSQKNENNNSYNSDICSANTRTPLITNDCDKEVPFFPCSITKSALQERKQVQAKPKKKKKKNFTKYTTRRKVTVRTVPGI